jgi:hypothetical protein
MLMMHVKVLSKPASAEQTAWVDAKNIFGVRPLDAITGTNEQALWVLSQVDHWLQK